MNPQDMTPVQIDEQLSGIHTRFYAAQDAEMTLRQRAARYGDGVAKMEAGELRYSSHNTERLAALLAEADRAEATARAILAETVPFDAEFDRRGGWTRAYLVDNSNGHVHSSMWCSTCFPTTRYAWLTQYSGHGEAEIVDDAGRRACTVCYPSAPVDVLRRASRIETPDRRARRLEREAKAKAKAAKAIEMPDGSPLKKDGWTINTIVSARNEAVGALVDDAWYGLNHPTRGEWLAYVDRAVVALAAKEGRPEAEVRAEIEAKAAKRIAKDNKEKAAAR